MFIKAYGVKADYNFNSNEMFNFNEVDKLFLWKKCPRCGLYPLVKDTNEERIAVCSCKKVEIIANSIIDLINEQKTLEDYDEEELMDNWNNYCITGLIP